MYSNDTSWNLNQEFFKIFLIKIYLIFNGFFVDFKLNFFNVFRLGYICHNRAIANDLATLELDKWKDNLRNEWYMHSPTGIGTRNNIGKNHTSAKIRF